MLKRLLFILTVLALCAGFAAAEDASGASAFEQLWLSDGAAAEIIGEAGGYRVTVFRGDMLWCYWCVYQADTGVLADTGFGLMCTAAAGPDGLVMTGETLYDDGAAVFALDAAGRLTWTDERDGAGDGVAFLPVARIAGEWSAEGFVLRVTREGDGFRAVVTREGEPTYEWVYACVYDEAAGRLTGSGAKYTVIRTEDGTTARSADLENITCAFIPDPDGTLRWQDDAEQAGDWLEGFTRVTDAFGFPLESPGED